MDEQKLDELRRTLRAARFSPSDLARFALSQHGWSDSDGGFGVVYPVDLDEYDRDVERRLIKNGNVEIFGHWGPPDGWSFQISEFDYVNELIRDLVRRRAEFDVSSMDRLRRSLTSDERTVD